MSAKRIEPDVALRIEAPGWRQAVPDIDVRCEAAVRAALAAPRWRGGAVEVGLLLADDGTITALNRRYRNKDSATNVLSFPAEREAATPGQPVLLGDVVLAFETCRSEAAQAEKPLAEHMSHLIVHGMLHLLGYDHEAESDAETMEALEVAILDELGIADPYRVPQNEMASSAAEGSRRSGRSHTS